MRPLIIDDAARAQARRIIAHAELHHYAPGADWIPGDDDRFVANLSNGYRAVFTFTQSEEPGGLWRHLSISVPGKNYPNTAAAFMIAQLFGFTGWDERTIDSVPDGWLMRVNADEHCVVIGQLVGAGETVRS